MSSSQPLSPPRTAMRGEMPSLPDPPRARGDALSTRCSLYAGRCPLYPILFVRGEIPSLPDPLHVRGDALSTRSSLCAGRCPLYPILFMRGEIPALSDPLPPMTMTMVTMMTMMLIMMMIIPATRTKPIRGSEEDDASDEDQLDEGLVSRRRCPTPTEETRLRS